MGIYEKVTDTERKKCYMISPICSFCLNINIWVCTSMSVHWWLYCICKYKSSSNKYGYNIYCMHNIIYIMKKEGVLLGTSRKKRDGNVEWTKDNHILVCNKSIFKREKENPRYKWLLKGKCILLLSLTPTSLITPYHGFSFPNYKKEQLCVMIGKILKGVRMMIADVGEGG